MSAQGMPLAEAARIIAAELEAAEAKAGTYADDPRDWHKRHRSAMEDLATRLGDQVGARVRVRWDGAHVRIAGLAASSTTGISGALRNWLAAARKREGLS